MKTYHIKDLLKKDLLIVELPENNWLSVFPRFIWICDRETNEYHHIKGSYTLLGKRDEIKEDDIKDLVDFFTETSGGKVYRLYPDTDFCDTALESFNSALETVIFWDVNPIGNEPELEAICCGNLLADAWGHPQCCGVPNATEKSIELHSMWQAAELRTFDRSRSIILVKQ